MSSRNTRRSSMSRIGGVAIVGAVLSTSAFVAPSAFAAPAPEPSQSDLAVGEHTVIVPDGVCAVNIVAAGAAGGNAITGLSETGGGGAVISASLRATPGQEFDVTVGGAGGGSGGYNGGGDGGPAGLHRGAGGGGYTEISFAGDLLLLAGGGGGAGAGHSTNYGWGGNAGVPSGPGAFAGEDGQDGQDGTNDPDNRPGGGTGAQVDAPGIGGVNAYDADRNGFAGDGRIGGQGGPDTDPDSGGGGGGGYFGGGGGAATVGNGAGGAEPDEPGGAGGGGSSFVSELVTFDSGALGSREDGTDGFATFDWVMCDYDLALEKTAASDVFEEDVPVEYTVTVTNLGPEAMAIGDTVTVSDDNAEGGTLTEVSTSADEDFVCTTAIGDELGAVLDCSIPVAGSDAGRGLAVGETLTLTYTQMLSGTDPVENIAGVTDRGNPDNNTASAVVDPAAPALELEKSVSPTAITEAGQELTYTFQVVNTGNIAVDDIAIDEAEFSGTGDLGTASCPDGSLMPGQEVTCTLTYLATQADVDAGEITNAATANGSTPGGNPVVSNESDAEVEAIQDPKLDLVKSADITLITSAGQDIVYTFTLTNSGNVTLTDLAVAEGQFSGTGSLSEIICPEEPLAPSESADCTATYTTTASDAKAESLTNTATASALDPSGDAVASDPSNVRIPVVPPLAVTGADSGPLLAGAALALTLTLFGGFVLMRSRRTSV